MALGFNENAQNLWKDLAVGSVTGNMKVIVAIFRPVKPAESFREINAKCESEATREYSKLIRALP